MHTISPYPLARPPLPCTPNQRLTQQHAPHMHTHARSGPMALPLQICLKRLHHDHVHVGSPSPPSGWPVPGDVLIPGVPGTYRVVSSAVLPRDRVRTPPPPSLCTSPSTRYHCPCAPWGIIGAPACSRCAIGGVNANELRLGFSNTTRNPEGILSHMCLRGNEKCTPLRLLGRGGDAVTAGAGGAPGPSLGHV
jgi:hypothetical protein